MKFYQAGGIPHDSNANVWRRKLIKALPMHNFWNPLEKEAVVAGTDLAAEFLTIKRFADLGDEPGLNRLRRIMLERIIPLDLEGVTWADALICRVKRNVRIWGSICEIYEAKMIQNKPVYLISDLKYIEMNGWEIALADKIWFSMDEAIKELRK